MWARLTAPVSGGGSRSSGWLAACRANAGVLCAPCCCLTSPRCFCFCCLLPLLPPQELAPFKNCVIATGGGAPTKSENWGHMQGGISVWLNGPPTLLAHRVVGDGTENRPLLAQVWQYMVGEGGCRLWLPVPFPAAA
jgi:hypothetical protein